MLDAFAGTGALGLEAMSRGAREVTFVESAKPALAVLRKNVDELGVTARIVAKRVEGIPMELAGERFDLVFCDPPWAEIERLMPVIGALAELLADGGTLVLEHDKRTPVPTAVMVGVGGLHVADTRVYGDTALSFFER